MGAFKLSDQSYRTLLSLSKGHQERSCRFSEVTGIFLDTSLFFVLSFLVAMLVEGH